MSNAFVYGWCFRILAVDDDFGRECLALVAATSLSGVGAARERTMLRGERGKRLLVVSDDGTTSRRASRPGTPSQRASAAACATND